MQFFQHKCTRCTHEWGSRLKRPAQCPKCKQPKWDTPARAKKPVEYRECVEPKICSCVVCGNKWTARTEAPRLCPSCKSPEWNGPSPKSRHRALVSLWKKSTLPLDQFAARIGTSQEKLAPYVKGDLEVTAQQITHIRSVFGQEA